MYNIRLSERVPEPMPATPVTTVAAHYYAAWKYGAAGLHEGFNDLADRFPERTPLMGYYDEENPEVCDWEIKWAVEHGISCFIYCWYRKPENFGKPVTPGDLRCAHGIHEALFNASFGKYMKFAVMYEASPRWCGTDDADLIANLMPFWTDNYFTRENYLTFDNKPVLFIYNQKRLTADVWREPEAQKRAFDRCREYARKAGFDGMIFACCGHTRGREAYEDIIARGYDFRFGYNSGYVPEAHAPGEFPPEEDVASAQLAILDRELKLDPRRHVATASCFYDVTPRTTERWKKLGYGFDRAYDWHLSPDGFRKVIRGMKERIETLPEDAWAKRIFMIDNWNEWDEGHFVAPSHQFGFRYLQAVREELTLRDNLPDYRTPRDQGFGGYNKSWRTPDFGDFCKKRSGGFGAS
ncbi:MAG: glycoside hydrolase family 99-like domain-containing protein [Clostridia bacterium]|nr:glycoside hydrolase family 99-like domain-containing protein [Clostridia bacterium]